MLVRTVQLLALLMTDANDMTLKELTKCRYLKYTTRAKPHQMLPASHLGYKHGQAVFFHHLTLLHIALECASCTRQKVRLIFEASTVVRVQCVHVLKAKSVRRQVRASCILKASFSWLPRCTMTDLSSNDSHRASQGAGREGGDEATRLSSLLWVCKKESK